MTNRSVTINPTDVLLSLGAQFKGKQAFRLEDWRSKRSVVVKNSDLAAIFRTIRRAALEAYLELAGQVGQHVPAAEANCRISQTAATLVDEILIARKNVALFRQLGLDGSTMPATVTLPVTRIDKPSGYYYPEKGRTAWFRAHGVISVDPNRLVRLDAQPQWQALLSVETEAYKEDPCTLFGIAGHGAFVYLLQAKRLNGRRYLFGKLVHDGQRAVRMTHWAKLVGANAATLIKHAGFDSSQL